MNGSLFFFYSDYLFPGFCLSSLFEGKRQNVTIIIHDMLLGQFPRGILCQMTSRLSGVTQRTGHSPNTRQSSEEVTQ